VTAGETHRAIEATFRIERAWLIAGLVRVVRNVDLAEELAQDALVVALSEWPRIGVPANPGAWLMALAKRRAIDAFRRDKMRERKHEEIARTLDETLDGAAEAIEAAMDDDLGDELLGLLFTACHPILSPDARAALTLRVVGGLTTDEIARAFLSSEATIAQRIVRAKKTIAKAGLGFETPRGAERAARLPSVLEVIYLIFNEGYAATAGDDLIRPALCLEAQRLGRILAGLMPDEGEVLGLLALMEIQASRLGARIGSDGAAIPITEQDRARWDHLLIHRGLDALARAEALGGPLGDWGPMSCKPRSPPATPARAKPPTPTGRASPRSMTGCASWCPRPWSISIARSPTAWPSGPKRASGWWTRSATPTPFAAMRPCRRRGATFCSVPADWPRRVQNSRLRPR
jgi:RNA polymerase sigma factor (sigma-70 family)